MPKRYRGNIITDTTTEPTENYQDSAASGVWSLAEANAYTAAGLWPTQGNLPPELAIFAGGSVLGTSIEKITITSTGNSTTFGNLPTGTTDGTAALGSATRGVIAGALGGSGSSTNVINYITFTSDGDSQDFGDLVTSDSQMVGSSNSTRGLFSGGVNQKGSVYITIATLGNAAFFGDLYGSSLYRLSACASSTRALVGVGSFAGGAGTVVDYYTISTTGGSTTFGDISSSRRAGAAFSSSTRGVFGGGEAGNGSAQNVIDYFTIASTGNATDFGDLTVARAYLSSASGSTRGVFSGGESTNVIDYVTIASTGNASDFGDLSVTSNQRFGGASNAHGGL